MNVGCQSVLDRLWISHKPRTCDSWEVRNILVNKLDAAPATLVTRSRNRVGIYIYHTYPMYLYPSTDLGANETDSRFTLDSWWLMRWCQAIKGKMMPPRCTAALLKLLHDEISLVGRKHAPSNTVLSLSFLGVFEVWEKIQVTKWVVTHFLVSNLRSPSSSFFGGPTWDVSPGSAGSLAEVYCNASAKAIGPQSSVQATASDVKMRKKRRICEKTQCGECLFHVWLYDVIENSGLDLLHVFMPEIVCKNVSYFDFTWFFLFFCQEVSFRFG